MIDPKPGLFGAQSSFTTAYDDEFVGNGGGLIGVSWSLQAFNHFNIKLSLKYLVLHKKIILMLMHS
jgi:hypothetical protein